MKKSFNLVNAIFISALALVVTNPSWGAETTRARADAPREAGSPRETTTRTAPPTRALSVQQASQRMMRQLRPEQALRLMQTQQNNSNPQYKPTDPKPPKYEVADCTGSNGVPKVCCSYTPGGGGSTCDMFILLCDQMSGTSSAGGGSAATCSGDGVLE